MTDRRRYRVEMERSVERNFCRLPRNLIAKLLKAIRSLEENPRPPGCRKLTGRNDTYRIRVGDWRIIYQIHDDRLIVLVIEVGPRGGVYRHL